MTNPMSPAEALIEEVLYWDKRLGDHFKDSPIDVKLARALAVALEALDEVEGDRPAFGKYGETKYQQLARKARIKIEKICGGGK